MKYIENDQVSKYINLCKTLKPFQIFKLRFVMNPQNGNSLIHMCAQHETLEILKFTIEHFR